MDNVYLQLELNHKNVKYPVADASDLRPALAKLWESNSSCSTSYYIDLVREDGRALDADEREEFFELVDADCEMAIGDCFVSAYIDFENLLDHEELQQIICFIDSLYRDGVSFSACSSRIEITSSEEIHFSALPNRNVRLSSARYETIESNASYASARYIKAVNDALETLVRYIDNEMDVAFDAVYFSDEFFDFRGDCPSFGDYRIVNLGDLLYGYV